MYIETFINKKMENKKKRKRVREKQTWTINTFFSLSMCNLLILLFVLWSLLLWLLPQLDSEPRVRDSGEH